MNDVYVSDIPLKIGNNYLRARSFVHDYILIDNGNISHSHLNRYSIHLNYNGTVVIPNIFVRAQAIIDAPLALHNIPYQKSMYHTMPALILIVS